MSIEVTRDFVKKLEPFLCGEGAERSDPEFCSRSPYWESRSSIDLDYYLGWGKLRDLRPFRKDVAVEFCEAYTPAAKASDSFCVAVVEDDRKALAQLVDNCSADDSRKACSVTGNDIRRVLARSVSEGDGRRMARFLDERGREIASGLENIAALTPSDPRIEEMRGKLLSRTARVCVGDDLYAMQMLADKCGKVIDDYKFVKSILWGGSFGLGSIVSTAKILWNGFGKSRDAAGREWSYNKARGRYFHVKFVRSAWAFWKGRLGEGVESVQRVIDSVEPAAKALAQHAASMKGDGARMKNLEGFERLLEEIKRIPADDFMGRAKKLGALLSGEVALNLISDINKRQNWLEKKLERSYIEMIGKGSDSSKVMEKEISAAAAERARKMGDLVVHLENASDSVVKADVLPKNASMAKFNMAIDDLLKRPESLAMAGFKIIKRIRKLGEKKPDEKAGIPQEDSFESSADFERRVGIDALLAQMDESLPLSLFTLASLVDTVVWLNGLEARKRGVMIGFTGADTTMAVPPDLRSPLFNALSELVDNAVAYSEANEASRAVAVSSEIEGDDVVFIVDDNGAGMSPAPAGHQYREIWVDGTETGDGTDLYDGGFNRIYGEMLARLAKDARGEGSGIPEIMRIARERGWRIEYSSVAGSGSKAKLSVPRAQFEENPPAPDSDGEGTPPAAAGEGSPPAPALTPGSSPPVRGAKAADLGGYSKSKARAPAATTWIKVVPAVIPARSSPAVPQVPATMLEGAGIFAAPGAAKAVAR